MKKLQNCCKQFSVEVVVRQIVIDYKKIHLLTVFLVFLRDFSFESLPFRSLCPFALNGGGTKLGGGGGIDEPHNPRGIKTFISSSSVKSLKSKSQSMRSRSIFFTNSSQCSSISDFFGSGFLRSFSTVALTSPLFLLFSSSSLAFDISPDISPMRLGFSSCGLNGKLLNFCVKSLTVCSRFSWRRSFMSSFSVSN